MKQIALSEFVYERWQELSVIYVHNLLILCAYYFYSIAIAFAP